MPVWLQASLAILFAYSSWSLMKRGDAKLLWFGHVSRHTTPQKFWFAVVFLASVSIANALLIGAKVS